MPNDSQFAGDTRRLRFAIPEELRDAFLWEESRKVDKVDSDLTPRNFYYETLHQLGHLPRFYRGDAKRQLNHVIIDLYENQKKFRLSSSTKDTF